MVVYDTQNHWVCGLHPSPCFCSCLEFIAMDEGHKPGASEDRPESDTLAEDKPRVSDQVPGMALLGVPWCVENRLW
jgi:hypothetical protein